MTCRVVLGVVKKQAVYGNSQSPFQNLTDLERLMYSLHFEPLNRRAVVLLVRLHDISSIH